MSTRKTITAALLIALTISGAAGRAGALNVNRSGGGHCARAEISTDARGWPTYRCLSYFYGR